MGALGHGPRSPSFAAPHGVHSLNLRLRGRSACPVAAPTPDDGGELVQLRGGRVGRNAFQQ